MKREITFFEECELKNIVIANWPYFTEFYMRGGPWPGEKAYRALKALQNNGILDEQMKVADNWRKAVVEVSKGRSIYELTGDDMKLVVEARTRWEFWPKKAVDQIVTAVK